MGFNSATKLAIKYGDNFCNACAKTRSFVNNGFQKPVSIYPQKPDQSLSPMSLQSLKNLESNDKLDSITKIKNLIMKAMGFKNPQTLEIAYDKLFSLYGAKAGFSSVKASILVTDYVLDKPIEIKIATLIHELDHLLKTTKLYKAIGKDKFKKATIMKMENKSFNGVPYKLDNPKYIVINDDFYEKIIDDVDLAGFNVKKYLEGYIGKPLAKLSHSMKKFEYYANALEDSGYKKEALVYKNLGVNYATSADLFPKNYLKIMNKLEALGIKNLDKKDEVFEQVLLFITGEMIGDKKYFKILQKYLQGLDISADECNYLENVLDNLPRDKCQNIDNRVERIISHGKFTQNDLLRKIDEILLS